MIDSDDLQATRHITGGTMCGQRMAVSLPPALGGVMIFQASGSAPISAF